MTCSLKTARVSLGRRFPGVCATGFRKALGRGVRGEGGEKGGLNFGAESESDGLPDGESGLSEKEG